MTIPGEENEAKVTVVPNPFMIPQLPHILPTGILLRLERWIRGYFEWLFIQGIHVVAGCKALNFETQMAFPHILSDRHWYTFEEF